jgi:hypothetical protein
MVNDGDLLNTKGYRCFEHDYFQVHIPLANQLRILIKYKIETMEFINDMTFALSYCKPLC